MSEENRIIEYYRERDSQQAYKGFFGYKSLADLLMHQERVRNTLQLLQKYNITSHSIGGMKILDVGCGSGGILREYLKYGATPENLAGIDLSADRVHLAKRLAPYLDIRCASAADIPYEDQTFDLVMQHVVFTSILQDDILFTIAQQMVRVLKPTGMILWYDYFYDNPFNSNVRAVKKDKIKQLFPDLKLDLSRITLAPPIARNIPKLVLPVVYPILSSFPFLCTHYLGVLHF